MQWFCKKVFIVFAVFVSVYAVQGGSQLDGENHKTIRYLLLRWFKISEFKKKKTLYSQDDKKSMYGIKTIVAELPLC